MASLWGSRRSTIGMLVDGSTISPRIFISMSIGTPSLSSDCFSDQTVRKTLRHPHRNIAAGCGHNRLTGSKVQGLILRRAPDHLPARRIMTLNHRFANLAYVLVVIDPLDFALALQQNLKPV